MLREWTDANASALWLAALLTTFAVTLMYSRSRLGVEVRAGVVAGQTRMIAAGLVAFLVFVAFAAFHRSGPTQVFDAAVGGALSSAQGTAAAQIAWSITQLGQPLVLAIAVGIGVVALLLSRRPWAGFLLVMTVLANGFAVRAFKGSFERLRPAQAETFALAADWSFPSGHAAGAMMVFGALAWLLARAVPAMRRWIAAFATLLILAVGASRIVLDVHHVTDVLAGFAIGAAHLCALVVMVRTIETRSR